MIRRAKILTLAAWSFILINVGGAIYGLAVSDAFHAAGHIGLLVLGGAAYMIWRSSRRTAQPDLPAGQATDATLDHLEQSVDRIALEVERIGEAQRFNAKILMERAKANPSSLP